MIQQEDLRQRGSKEDEILSLIYLTNRIWDLIIPNCGTSDMLLLQFELTRFRKVREMPHRHQRIFEPTEDTPEDLTKILEKKANT